MNKIAKIALGVAFLGIVLVIISCAPQETAIQQSEQKKTTAEDSARIALEIKKYLSFGLEYYKNKQYNDAIRNFKKVLSMDPSNELAHKYLADSYLRHPDSTMIDSAFVLYSSAIKKFPNTAYFYSGYGYVLHKVARRYADLAEQESDSAKKEALQNKSGALIDSALVNFHKAVELDTGDYASMNALGTIYLSRGRLDSAMKWLGKSVEIDSNQVEIWDILAKIYVARGLNKEAARAYKHLHRLMPEESEYLLKYGQYLAKSGDLKKSLDILNEYINKNPNDYRGYQYLGLVMAFKKNYKDALRQLKKAEKLNPKSVKLMCDIASVYKDMKNYALARRYLAKAKKIDPKFGYIYIVEGDIVYQQAMDLVPESGELNMAAKCKLLTAYKIYKKALADPNWAGFAKSKMDYLKKYLPTREEIKAYEFMGNKCE